MDKRKTTIISSRTEDLSSSDSSDDSSTDSNSKVNIPKNNGNLTGLLLQAHSGNEDDSSSDDSSSEDSNDSSDEEDTPKKVSTANVDKSKAESSSSASEDSEDDASSIPSKQNADTSDDDGSSDDSDDDSNENSEEESVKVQTNDVKKKTNDSENTNDSSSSDDSDSESEGIVENKIKNEDDESDDDEKVSVKEKPLNEQISQNLSNSNKPIDVPEKNGAKRMANEFSSVPIKKPKIDVDGSSNCQVVVRNLSYNVDDDWLNQEFQEAGKIVSAQIKYDNRGRSQGIGYIEFESSEDAQGALRLTGKEIDGRRVNVSITVNQKNGYATKRDTSEPSETIFIGNLPFEVTEDEIRGIFDQCGDIISVRLPTHQDTGKPRGFGYVTFANIATAQNALELDGTEIGRRQIRLDFAPSRQNDSGFRKGFSPGRGGRGRGGDRGGRGGRGGDRGGRGANYFSAANRGVIVPSQGKKIVFDD
ncbi:7346_t:CDS:2 [Acaulospora morrowiae]|uniref:7346_t:CDS:1 n=1 Tax=Acaulospora morrowiae TaxID=94023 RepID=A0A9N9E9N2_9GLOM|nr:7346_t:CDS:2 [Acaulospora morrowiae]